MKYTCSIVINASVEKVVDLWKNEDYFQEWQDGFQSIEHISGVPNTIGAKSKIIIEGRQRIELIETILKNNLPEEKIGLYEHKHMTNTQRSRFIELNDGSTRYISEVEYTEFKGIMISIIAKLFPSQFKKQSQKWMRNFKEFVENHRQD